MALTVNVKVIPNSGKSAWQIDKHGKLKCFLKSAPEKGAANKELIKTLSKSLKIPQMDIEITSGLTERNKRIKIHTGLTFEIFLQKIGIQNIQQSID